MKFGGKKYKTAALALGGLGVYLFLKDPIGWDDPAYCPSGVCK
jgi:hypothetical protein